MHFCCTNVTAINSKLFLVSRCSSSSTALGKTVENSEGMMS